MAFTYKVGTFLCIMLMLNVAHATTLRPFPNLARMAEATEQVVSVKVLRHDTVQENGMKRFYALVEVRDLYKGNLQKGQRIRIGNYHLKIGDLERTIFGDLELESDRHYLLFLDQRSDGIWQAPMLSYGCFEMVNFQQQDLWVPLQLGKEVHVHDHDIAIEPLRVMKVASFGEHLKAVLRGKEEWNSQRVDAGIAIEQFQRGAPPGHCTFLSGTPYARWQNLSTTNLPVRYHNGGDPGCGTAPNSIGSAIATMNSNYDGVNLVNAGTHSFVPSCNGEGATDDEFTDWINANLGGNRHLLVQFDDPCSEISDLSGCNGTIAIGGLYWFSSTHTFNGMTWRNAAYGYVVVNNGTGACQCGADYTTMMIHEMTHSLNIGHIAGSGTANMNSQCCVNISSLDVQCLDFVYADPALPIELISFNGRPGEHMINLDWHTASEINNDHFIVEKYVQNEFVSIGTIQGAGTVQSEQFYDFIDHSPTPGENLYRLVQIDYDGNQQILPTVVVEFFEPFRISIAPNPVQDKILQGIISTDMVNGAQIDIIDSRGISYYRSHLSLVKGLNDLEVSLPTLSAGLYFIRIRQNQENRLVKFMMP